MEYEEKALIKINCLSKASFDFYKGFRV